MRQVIYVEVDAKWEKGHRKDVENAEKARMNEWGSLMELKHLGWPEFDLTEADEERQLMVEDRRNWTDKVSRQEERNRQGVGIY